MMHLRDGVDDRASSSFDTLEEVSQKTTESSAKSDNQVRMWRISLTGDRIWVM